MENKAGMRIFTVALTIAFLLFAFGCSKKKPAEKAVAPAPGAESGSPGILSRIKQEVYSFKVEGFNRDKKVQWGLEGESANVMTDKIHIKNLRAVYYGDDMTLTVFADRAVYDKKTQDIELESNIEGSTSDGGKLLTDYAKWHADSEEITTDAGVVVTRENIRCRGNGLITRPRLKRVTFREDVEVDIEPDKKITCDGPFEIDHENNVAVFNTNVRVIDKDSDTFTDRLTVYLEPGTNRVERIVTEGNVRVVHKGELEKMGNFSFN